MTQFILARTATGRPALQHSLADDGRMTKCGLDSHRWSRAYTEQAVPTILCKRCAVTEGIKLT